MTLTWLSVTAVVGALALSAPGTAAAAEHGLVAYWSFDEGAGKVARDYSGNGRDITVSGVHWTQGVCGGALEFRGRDSVQCAPAEDGLFLFPADYTVAVWARHTSKRPQRYISKWTGKGDRSAWWLGYYENKAQFGDYFDGGQSRPCAVDVADGKWHQVVGVRRGKTAYLYVDGRLATKTSTPGMVAGYNSAPVVLGAYAGGWPIQGALDEVRVYCRALTAEEIRNRYERIRSGGEKPTLSVVAGGPMDVPTYLMLFPGKELRGLTPWYNAHKPVSVDLVVSMNKRAATPMKGEIIASLIPETGGASRTKRVPFVIPPGANRKTVAIDWPPLPRGKYSLEASVAGHATAHLRKEVGMLDMDAIVQENLRFREARRKGGDPFARGIVSSYAGLLYGKDGYPDVDRTLARIRDLGVNGYTYLISGKSDRALARLPEFCTKAAKVGIEVWAYLVPPTEAPQGRDKPIPQRKYPPFDMDYLKWADAIARIGAAHPNLTLWMIDDFDGNTGFFTKDYTKRMYETSKRIAPKLRFGVCVYYDSIGNFMKAGYGPYFDAVLWGYQHSFPVFPEAGVSAATLPIEINEYFKLCPNKVLIPCVYFTRHSSWPHDRPTKPYLAEALRVSFEQAGICWVFTTPPPGSWKASIVREFCHSAVPPALAIPKENSKIR